MKKYFFLLLIMSNAGHASFLITKMQKAFNIFKPHTYDQESLLSTFPFELLFEITKYLDNQGKINLSSIKKSGFDIYRREVRKILCQDIGKNRAKIDLPFFGFVSEFSDVLFKIFNTNHELFNNNRNEDLAKLTYESYKQFTENNFPGSWIQFSEFFLLNRSHIMKSKVSGEDITETIKECGIEQSNEKFEFNNLDNEKKELIVNLFSIQNDPVVVVVPKASEVILSLGDLIKFLTKLVDKYSKIKRIIVDSFKNKDEENKTRIELFDEIASILQENNIIIQNKNGHTLFYQSFNQYPFSKNNITQLENICEKYHNFVKINLKARNNAGYTMFDRICTHGYEVSGSLEFIKLLLIKKIAQTNDVDLYGKKTLHNIIKKNTCLDREEKIELLIKYGANVNEKDYFDKTPLEYCTGKNTDIRCAKILLKHGAIFPENPNEQILQLKETIFPISSKFNKLKPLFFNDNDTFSF